MQGKSNREFSQGGAPQCTVECFPSKVWQSGSPAAVSDSLQPGRHHGIATKGMRWPFASSPSALGNPGPPG